MSENPSKEKLLHNLISYDCVAVSEHETVGAILDILRLRKSNFRDKASYLYVTDKEKKLVGILQMQDLLVNDSGVGVRDIMNQNVVSINEDDLRERIIETFHQSSFFSLPVVNSEGKLLGVVSRARIEKVFKLPARQEFYQFAQFSREEVEGKKVMEIVLRRLPWLLISITMGLVCSYMLGIFIGKIESIVALILFVPIVLGLSGSIGTQSSLITMRGLEQGKLEIAKILKVLTKETGIGAVLGLTAFFLVAVISLLWQKNLLLSLAFGISIIVNIAVSGMLGVVLAIIFKMARFKSNFASGLFLLLICDTVALILYFVITLSIVNPVIDLS
jgi:magnesium transporter